MGNKSRRRRKAQTGFQWCPECGAEVPESLVGCWNCGYILDRHLVELKEGSDESKGKDKNPAKVA